MSLVKLFADGACLGNPGMGGYGGILIYGADRREYMGGTAETTTNNRMELTAVIEGLKLLTRSVQIEIYTDSKYVVDGMNIYIKKWKQNGWYSASKKPVLNQDLWVELDCESAKHKASFHWVRGHNGHPDNERADQLANAGIPNFRENII